MANHALTWRAATGLGAAACALAACVSVLGLDDVVYTPGDGGVAESGAGSDAGPSHTYSEDFEKRDGGDWSPLGKNEAQGGRLALVAPGRESPRGLAAKVPDVLGAMAELTYDFPDQPKQRVECSLFYNIQEKTDGRYCEMLHLRFSPSNIDMRVVVFGNDTQLALTKDGNPIGYDEETGLGIGAWRSTSVAVDVVSGAITWKIGTTTKSVNASAAPGAASGVRVAFGVGNEFEQPGTCTVWIDDVVCDLR